MRGCMSQLIHTDILIIGAGPAGATCSLFLSKLKTPHLILEAAKFPRDKVCGDGLDLKVARVLRALDPELPALLLAQADAVTPCRGARLFTPGGHSVDFKYYPKSGDPHPFPLLYCAKRLFFDNFLAERIPSPYADFRQETAVKSLARTADGQWLVAAEGPQGLLQIQAKMVVGADGDHSVLLRHLGARKIDRSHYAGTLRQYWKGIEGLGDHIEIYFPKGLPMSYFYIFPLPNGEANVGYGMVSSLLAQKQHNLRDLFKKLIETDPLLAPRFAAAEPLEKPIGWGLPLASRRRPASGEGWLLLGDAASLVCPTSGEGIGTGMMSGYIAAHFLARACMVGDYSPAQFRNYDKEIYRRLEEEIRLFRIMMRMPVGVYDWMLSVGVRMPFFRKRFVKLAPKWLQTAFEKEIAIDF